MEWHPTKKNFKLSKENLEKSQKGDQLHLATTTTNLPILAQPITTKTTSPRNTTLPSSESHSQKNHNNKSLTTYITKVCQLYSQDSRDRKCNSIILNQILGISPIKYQHVKINMVIKCQKFQSQSIQ